MEENTGRRRLPNWLRMTAVATVAFVGGLGGLYFGHLLLAHPGVFTADGHQETLATEAPDILPAFQEGDLFPLESYTDVNGQPGNFEQLLWNKRSVVMFISLGCEPCHDLLDLLQQGLHDWRNSDVQLIALIGIESNPIPKEYLGLFDDITVLFIDRPYWETTYDLTNWPTIIGVDESGFAVRIQAGYGGYLKHGIVEHFLKSNR